MKKLLLIAFFLSASSACQTARVPLAPIEDIARTNLSSHNFNYAAFLDSIKDGGGFILLKGLPSAFAKDYQAALTEPHLSLLGHQFFAFDYTKSDGAEVFIRELTAVLRAIVSQQESREGYSPMSVFCIFHPDYAVVWSRPEGHYGILFCLSCNEWVFFAPQSQSAKSVTSLAASNALEAYLSDQPTFPERPESP